MDFHYKDIVPWGRSFNEYLGMFNLSEDDLARDIVDIGGGPASFNAVMHQRGTPIISIDPIYPSLTVASTSRSPHICFSSTPPPETIASLNASESYSGSR